MSVSAFQAPQKSWLPQWRKRHSAVLAFSRSGSVFPKLLDVFFPLSAWLYGVRIVLAVALALFAAFVFQLQESGVAATTVMILANPVHGLVLSKGLWRFFATLAGGVGSIVLVAVFIQTPELFIIALALWSGFFTALGSFLKHFRVYAAALTGYTVAIITLQVVDDPLLVFDHTIDRIEAICVGIASVTVVTGILASRTSSRHIEREFSSLMSECLAALGCPDSEMSSYSTLMARLRSFDTLIEGTSHEPSQQASRVHFYRNISNRLASLMILNLVEMKILRNLHVRFCERSITSIEKLQCYYEAMRERAVRVVIISENQRLELMALLDQSSILAGEIAELSREDSNEKSPSIYAGDIRRAALNGIRSTIGALTIGYYWIYSGAPYGAYILSGVILTSCLLATADDSKRASAQFGMGVVLASVAAIAFTFCLLPRLTEFGLLVGGLALFIIPGCLLATKPKHTLVASGYLIFFMIFTSLNNVATFDAVNSVNTEVGWVIGALYSTILFRTIFPSGPEDVLDYHVRALAHDSLEKIRPFDQRRLSRYEARVYHHAMQVGLRLSLNALDAENPSVKALKDAFVRISVLKRKSDPGNQIK